ncbi:uncharacterized protein LOC143367980 [Andrena cerasifolii]|uniref:uncharacterized protein LOC143367980 n=1 Tax=Andrena cerasifolii TaxID=2819439 RepID=UPI004037C210
MSEAKKCKGCRAAVVNPVICSDCGVATHTGTSYLGRSGQPWHNSRLLNCKSAVVVSPAATNLSGTQSALSQVSLPTVDDITDLMRSELNNFLEGFMTSVKSKLAGFQTVVDGLSDRVNNLEQAHSSGVCQASKGPVHTDEIIAEINERAILAVIHPADYGDLKIRRLGKLGEGPPRPLCVWLGSADKAKLILRNKHRYQGPCKISDDRTWGQRQSLEQLRSRLRDLQADGDTTSTIRTHCLADRVDIIILVEKWLHSSISSFVLGLDEYNVFRYDRSDLTSRCPRGGGVLIAVNKSLPCTLLRISNNNLEQIFVRVKVNNRHMIIGAIYLPPSSSHELYRVHSECVTELFHEFSSNKLFVVGDFNLPHAVWNNVGGSSCSRKPAIPGAESLALDFLLESYNYLNLAQINTTFSQGGNMLDLIFAADTGVMVESSVDCLTRQDQYHPPLLVRPNVIFVSDCEKRNEETYDFKRGAYPSIVNYLNSIDWDRGTGGEVGPDAAVDFLYKHLRNAIGAYVPLRRVWRSSFSQWFSPRLKKLIRQKKKMHRGYKNTKLLSDYLNFSGLRTLCKSFTKSNYSAYLYRT